MFFLGKNNDLTKNAKVSKMKMNVFFYRNCSSRGGWCEDGDLRDF